MKSVKLLYIFVLLTFSIPFHSKAQWTDITNLSGTSQNYSGINVTVSGQGETINGGCQGLYWIEAGNNNYYQFDFSVPVAGVRLVVDAVNQGETVEFEINGIVYPIDVCNFDTANMQYNNGCYLNTCSVLNNQLINDNTVFVCGAAMVFYGPINSFKVRTPINTTGPTFNVSFAPIGNYVGNISNCGVNNSIANNFSVYNTKTCSGPNLSVYVNSYIPGMNVKTIFGDGTYTTSLITAAGNGGYAVISHLYASSGAYTVKQVLYNGNDAIDSLLFPYDHAFCATMSVKIYNDANSNCIYDQGADVEGFFPVKVEVDSVNIPIDTISCTSGFTYTAFGNVGDVYKFKMLPLSGGMVPTCPVTGFVTDVLQQGVNATKYIGVECPTSNNFDFAAYAGIPVTGANDQWGHLYVVNSHCYAPNATLTLQHSPKYKYVGGANPQPVSYSNNTLTWNLSGIDANSPGPTSIYFVFWKNGNPLLANDTVKNRITINPIVGDVNPINNSIIVIDTVDASCDPNAIYATPSGCVEPGTNLEYKITFENIGNMPAENIYVLDTLPAGLDPSSMQLKFASHSMFVEKIYNGSQVILKFNFPNIMLPDSSDHEGCHGMFIYTIDTKNNYPIGSSINHKASIYFDYNLPVVTNTVSTLMCWPTNVEESTATKTENILIYPNPATEQLTIKTEKQYSSFTISNSIGQVMMKNTVKAKESRVDIKSLAPGIYYLNLKGEGGTEVRKFVKM